jgi:hypothetical protein
MFHKKITIGGKDVYIVESHHCVLEPWAEIRRCLSAEPALLTLDHHTDTHSLRSLATGTALRAQV